MQIYKCNNENKKLQLWQQRVDISLLLHQAKDNIATSKN